MDKPQQTGPRRAPKAVAKRKPKASPVKKPPASVKVPKKRTPVAAETAAEVEPGCRHCGGRPAADVEFRAVRGFLRSYDRTDMPGPWCSDCGEATYRSAMNRTLIGAWWGNRSFFGGIAAIRANRKSRRTTAALAAPVRAVDSPGAQDPGRPLWRRSGAVVAAVMTFVLVLAGIGIAVTAGDTPADEFADTCVRFDDANERVRTVSCDDANDGKVLKIVATEKDCPAAATITVTLTDDADKVLCVDDTR